MDLIQKLLNQPMSTREAIMVHLHYLLNSRQGSLAHIDAYGLSDCANQPASSYAREVARLIARFEPRIKQLSVSDMDTKDQYCKVKLLIQGVIHQNESLCLHTLIPSQGQVLIQEVRP